MNCSCIRGNYNIYVEALDKNTIIYQDLSDWMDDPRYSAPSEYDVQVIPPDGSTGKLITLSVLHTNRISSEVIGPIEDGIWCFQTESCDKKYKRSVGIFYNIECCLIRAFATKPDRIYADLKEVEKYVDLAKSAVSIKNIQSATDCLEIAQKKLEIIKCDCNC